MPNLFTQLLVPVTPANGAGDQRGALVQENADPSIGTSVQNFFEQVLAGAESGAIRAVRGTSFGRRLEDQARQQVFADYWQQWSGWIMVGLIALVGVLFFTQFARR